MAQQFPNLDAHSLPPLAKGASPTGPVESGGTSTILPFPIGETPYRPYLRPHRLAQTTRDPEMAEALRDTDAELARAAHEFIGDEVLPVIGLIAGLTLLAGVIASVL